MNKYFLRLFVWATLSFTSVGVLHAHQDTLIKLEGINLIGLPKKYSPAELDMKAFRVRIAKHEMSFSPFLKNLFEEPHDLRVSASWYHDSATLPHYVHLHIQPKKKDFSYKLLLNLETLELIELSVVLQTSDSGTWHLPIELDKQQKRDIQSATRILK